MICNSRHFLAYVLGGCCALAANGCFAPIGTTRVVDGHTSTGRYISPDAYAITLRAALLEAHGQLSQARSAYLLAVVYDKSSPEIWSRIGALDCRLDPQESAQAFARAEALDASYEPLWRERARCHLRRNELNLALEAAERAVALDPGNPESTGLAVRSLTLRGDAALAERWRRGFLLAATPASAIPTSLDAAEHGDDPAPLPTARLAREPLLPTDLDAALTEPDLAHARALAVAHGLPATELALRAVEIGLPIPALLEADLVLGADPENADARVAALAAADLSGNEPRFQALLATPPRPLRPLGARARVLLSALLARRAGVPLNGAPDH